jgi:hypothetical protein
VEVQPTPKLGDWFEVLTESREAKLPKREHRSTQRLFEELRGRMTVSPDSVHRFIKCWRKRVRITMKSAGVAE